MRKILVITAILLGLILGGAGAACWALSRPSVILLVPARGAEWIRRDRPFDLVARSDPWTVCHFRSTYAGRLGVNQAVLRLMALRKAVVYLDGQQIFDSGPDAADWKTEKSVTIPDAGLAPGTHVLDVVVTNPNGPSMLRADCGVLGITSGRRWQASEDGRRWSAAATADQIWEPAICEQFETTGLDLRRLWPVLGGLFVVGAGATIYVSRKSLRPGFSGRRAASLTRWILLIAWLVLAINNLAKLSTNVGYDAHAHFDYIQYVARHGSLPLPDGGWQFFQTPIYYVISAAFYRFFESVGVGPGVLESDLRLIPLACGAVMVQVCYAAGRIVFPRRYDLQIVTTVAGGLMPVNLYMGQSLSNEPLVAVFCGVVVLMTLRLLCRASAPTWTAVLLLGLMLGLAVLTKMSAVIWFFPVILAVAWTLRGASSVWWRKTGLICFAPVVAVSMCCPYFLRNRLQTGQWVYSHSQLAGIEWSQDPGFRVPAELVRFGHVFSHPGCSGLRSVWDSLYGTFWASVSLNGEDRYAFRPPWNYGLMSCGLWLAIFPMVCLIAGGTSAICVRKNLNTEPRTALAFAAIGIGCFVLAVFYVFLTLPVQGCAKGSYLLSTLPCVGILVAAGMAPLLRHRLLRAVVMGLFFAWAVDAYFTYFIF